MKWTEQIPHHEVLTTRRDFLRRGGGGFGALALSAMLGGNAALQRALGAPEAKLADSLTPKLTHLAGKAKSVIFLFMEGGPSHIDLFDPKPLLNKIAGKPLPDSFERPITAMGESGSALLASPREWKQYGESGLWVSDWMPHVGGVADELAVIRSCVSDGINHAGGVCQMNTGSQFGGRPSLGSWVTYGLGTENRNLPAFVVMQDSDSQVVNGVRNWGAGFMPAVYQGVRLESDGVAIDNLNNPKGVAISRQEAKLGFLARLNRKHGETRETNTDLDARIQSYELAFRMQAEAPEAVDLSLETEETKALYGMDQKETATYGRLCLLGRRLAERGVRFIQLYHGAGSKWDSHDNIEKKHAPLCHAVDKPIAGLIRDLKRRGMLDETLVIWGGEFGRTPMSEKGSGRDHNPTGFTMWMAGGGVQGGQVIGATDDLGLYAVQDKLHVHDLHSTVMHLMGLDHTQVIYRHKGRPERIDMNEGHAYEGISRA